MTRQRDFAAALLDPAAAVPAGLTDPYGQPAPKRFTVYRNNVALSLTRALEAGFPTVQKLVGEAFFAAMAGAFLRAYPPRSRMLMLYGDALPDWLHYFAPAAHLGYLPDVARLDQAMRESYHAADATPLAEVEFQRLLGADISDVRLRLAPSVRLLRSHWPIVSIWSANHRDGPTPQPGGEDALILRPGFDPLPHRLPPGGGAFIGGLLDGMTLGESLALSGEAVDLSAILGLLILGRAIIGADA